MSRRLSLAPRRPGRLAVMMSRPLSAAAAVTAAVTAALLLAGCSLAPAYHRPADLQVPQYKEIAGWAPAQPATAGNGPWWQLFGDARLNELEGRLAEGNPDLRAAFERFAQARALALAAHSNEFPSLGLGADATRERYSENGQFFQGQTYNDFSASLNLAWEIDVFGRLRNTAAAAAASAQASAADFAAVKLSLQAELATDYFNLRGDDAVIRLLADSVETFHHATQMTTRRYQVGTAAATDVDQAQTLEQDARAQLAATRLQRAQLEHAIAVLLGLPPAAFTLPAAPLTEEPPVVEVGLPSTLLQRRPDVASAERAVFAANAEIGVARAAWFPVFSLQSTALGLESVAGATWLSAPSRFWSVGPTASLPLLDAGARVAVNRQARASYAQAVANYRKATLTAYQEVEDNLAALHFLSDQQAADEAASKSAQSSAYHADERYAAGVADYVEVTTTHTAALQAQSAALMSRTARMDATVALVRALGGGWTRSQLDQPPTQP
ncbi:MAG TPA: efflux transporter outer membrane subunit [Steroidobacteraceae bacterium]|nr:efflux transporter outer membrane subunit [Steroidobacteraceae bacterium]